MVITDEGATAMRWPWVHPEPHPTPLEEAILLTEHLLAEHARLVQTNHVQLLGLKDANDAATREKSHG